MAELIAFAADAVVIAVEAVRIAAGHSDRTLDVARSVAGSAGAIDVIARRDARVVARRAIRRLTRCGRGLSGRPCLCRPS